MQKILKIIILIGIFILPLINSRITNLLGFSFSMPVNGNFEFTKVMFFNVWSSVVIGLFFINYTFSPFLKGSTFFGRMKKRGRDYGLWTMIFFFYMILILSTYFSVSPFVSFLGNETKAHSLIMWSNLIGLFIVFQSVLDKNFLKRIIQTFILSGVCVSVIGLKEYFFPTFDYGELGNRLFSTFGHPNYLSIFLVALMPFLYYQNIPLLSSTFRGRIAIFVILLFSVTLLLTKSVFAIFLFICFNIYFVWNKSVTCSCSKNFLQKSMKLFLIPTTIVAGLLLLNFFPEKLHSFVSRFFIWETTLRVIFSNFKIFLFGGGAETFIYHFDNFKGEYLYIFENLGFSADRPHNVILNFFYHFGVLGLFSIVLIYFLVGRKIKELSSISNLNKAIVLSLALILLFLLLNFASIVLYVLIVILLSFIIQKTRVDPSNNSQAIFITLFVGIISLTSLFGSYQAVKFYVSETKSFTNGFLQAQNIYNYNANNYFYTGDFDRGLQISHVKTPEYYFAKLYFIEKVENKKNTCNEFIDRYNYSETYFHCGDIFWNIGQKEIAENYYNDGLQLLPDLWNKDSKYYDNFLIKTLKINGNRFLSDKYGLGVILEKLDKQQL